MPNPSKRWDRVPVYGFYFKADDTTPITGQIHMTVQQRITRVDGRTIYPEGAVVTRQIGDHEADAATRDAVRAAWRAADELADGEDFDGAAWDAWWNTMLTGAVFASFPANDDPDIVQTGYQVKVEERLNGGQGKVFYIEPLLAQLDIVPPGINLGLIEVPPGAPAAPLPVYAKGIPGGVAALNNEGQVVNAAGDVVDAAFVQEQVDSVANQLSSKANASTVQGLSQTVSNVQTTPEGKVGIEELEAGFSRKTAVDLREFGTITPGSDHTGLLEAANNQLAHGDTLIIPGEVVINTGDVTFDKALTLDFRHGGKLNMTGGFIVTLPNAAGAFRLIDPYFTADSSAPGNTIMVDMTAGDELVWQRGTVRNARRVLRTLNVPVVTVDRPRIRQLDNPDPAVTGTLVQVRDAWQQVDIIRPRIIMPDTSETVTNSQSGIAVNGGRNVSIDQPVIDGGYSGVVVRESSSDPLLLSEAVDIRGGTYRGQRATGGPAQGIYCQKIKGLSIIGTHVYDFGGTAVAVAYEWTDDLTYIGNIAHTTVPTAEFGHLITKARGGTVQGNIASGTVKFGTQCSDSDDLIISGNDSRSTYAGGGARAYVLSGLTRGRWERNAGSSLNTGVRIIGAMADTVIGEYDISAPVPLDAAGMTGSIRLNDRGTTAPPANVLAAVGSTRYNSSPAAGGAPGWVYTSAGWSAMAPAPLSGSAGWNPPSVASGASASTTVTVTGAALGDHARASFSTTLPAGIALLASVTAVDSVTVTLLNLSGTAFDHAGGTVRVAVSKP